MPYVPSNITPNMDDDRAVMDDKIVALAEAIATAAMRHKYDAAFAGELNYALTRLIQIIPRKLVAAGQFKDELRYWIQPLLYGVLLDVALEHKRRVNVAYEASQIIKSGDCFDTPYYTKLAEVVDSDGRHVGHIEVMVKRSEATLNKNCLDEKIGLKILGDSK